MDNYMRNRVIFRGTLADMPDGNLVRVTVFESALIKVKGAAFAATLQSVDEDCDPQTVRDLPETAYSDLNQAVDFGVENYKQTLGKGFYGLRFTAATGEIVISETS